jgi:hypothetical protein
LKSDGSRLKLINSFSIASGRFHAWKWIAAIPSLSIGEEAHDTSMKTPSLFAYRETANVPLVHKKTYPKDRIVLPNNELCYTVLAGSEHPSYVRKEQPTRAEAASAEAARRVL